MLISMPLPGRDKHRIGTIGSCLRLGWLVAPFKHIHMVAPATGRSGDFSDQKDEDTGSSDAALERA